MNALLLNWLDIQMGRRDLELKAHIKRLTAQVDILTAQIQDPEILREVKERRAEVLHD